MIKQKDNYAQSIIKYKICFYLIIWKNIKIIISDTSVRKIGNMKRLQRIKF